FFTWSPSHQMSNAFIADPIISPVRSTLYTVEVRAGACLTTDDILVNVQNPISVAIQADTNRICAGEDLQLISVGGSGAAQYSWTPALYINDPTIPDPFVNPETDTWYTIQLVEGVCEAEDSFLVLTNPRPEAGILASQTEGCAPLMVQFLENSPNAIAYRWQFGDESQITNDADPAHIYPQAGEYPVTLTVWGQGGCSATDTLIVAVSAGGQAAFTVEGQQPGLLPAAGYQFLDASERAISWFWDFGDGTVSSEANPAHAYKASGQYRVVLTTTDAAGCIDTAQAILEIADPDLLIPNVFSPNNDGINDAYQIEYTGKDAYALIIYDRWGRTVFGEVYSPAQTWDGLTPQGKPASAGVYYYRVTIGEQTFTGDLTLLR
ncbi:MAG: PKD domain-containing protein, partial [Bacteroidota bacterium]